MGAVVGASAAMLLGPASASGFAGRADTGTSINDAATTHRIQFYAAGLVLAGLALGAVTMWLWRSTKPDPEALGALSVMSRRKWRRGAEDDRVHALARAHNIPDPPAMPPPVDLAVLARQQRGATDLDDHAGFGDLVEPGTSGSLPGPGLPRPEFPPPVVPGTDIAVTTDSVLELALPLRFEPAVADTVVPGLPAEPARTDAAD